MIKNKMKRLKSLVIASAISLGILTGCWQGVDEAKFSYVTRDYGEKTLEYGLRVHDKDGLKSVSVKLNDDEIYRWQGEKCYSLVEDVVYSYEQRPLKGQWANTLKLTAEDALGNVKSRIIKI